MKTKICTICKIEKPLQDFYYHNKRKKKLRPDCKICFAIKQNKWKKRNIKKFNIYHKNYYKKYKKQIQNQRQQFKKQFPWIQTLKYIKGRCDYKINNRYYCYGKIGIKCLITSNELKTLWFRDKAYLMKKPSIDRIDNDKNYTFENCRYIELNKNTGLSKQKIIVQYNLNGKFIKEWESLTKAGKTLNISIGDIYRVANNQRNHAGTFIWKYKEV